MSCTTGNCGGLEPVLKCEDICRCIKVRSTDKTIRIVKKGCTWDLEINRSKFALTTLIEAGTNISVSGTGEIGDPYIITNTLDAYTKTELQTSGQAEVHWDNLTNVPAFSSTLDGLTDVTITSPISGEVLSYNGSIWVNSTPTVDWSDITNLPTCFDPCPGSSNYIWNQDAAEQPTSNFWISGTGQATRFQANHIYDTGTPDASFLSTGTLTGTANGHGFRDQTQFIRVGYAYCNYDAQSDIGLLNNNFDHIVAFQSRNKWQGLGTLNYMYGTYTEHQVNGGTVSNVYSHYAGDATGAGTITNHYAFYAAEILKGTNRYAVYTKGSTPSIFEGNVGIGLTNPSVPEPDPTIASPGKGIVIAGNSTDWFPYVRFKYNHTPNASDATITTDQNKMIFWSPSGGGINQYRFYSGGNQIANLSNIGLYIGTSTLASARLHLPAQTASAGTAPIKLTTGGAVAMTTPEDGVFEYYNSHIYFTIGSTRYQLDQQVTGTSAVTSFNGRTGAVVPQLGDYTTTIVAEGTNLYYTQARFDSAFAAKTTTNLAEGTNLYFTNARARSALSAGTGISYNSGTGVISADTSYLNSNYHKQGGNAYTADSVVGTTDAFGLIFRTNNSDRGKIYSNGNMSIGTTTDTSFKLQVTGNFRATGSTYNVYTDASGGLAQERISNGNQIYRFATNGDFSGRFDIYNSTNTVASSISGGTTDSYINGGGNFAVGSSTANGFKVYVSGNQALTEYIITSRSGTFSNGIYLNGTSNFGTLQTTTTNLWSLGYDSTHGNARLGTAVLSWNSSGRVMIGTTTDAGYKQDVNGTGRYSDALKTNGFAVALSTKTANYTAVKTDHILLCNATSGAITVTLPTVGIETGQEYIIKKTDASANAVIIDPNSTATIDGASTYSITIQYNTIKCVFDGTNYWII